jgi:tetratricopeptide (TPR) repeat protein
VTLSKLPSEPPKATSPDPEARQFLALNRQVYRELLTFIDFAADFTVGFVEVNFSPNVEMLIQSLQADPICQEIQFEVMDFSQQPDLRFLRDEIVQRLPTIERHPAQKLVLVVLGLKEAIGVNLQGDYPPVLQDLNFVRDAYKRTVPHPILFFLPDYAITRLAKFAPDFWAWRSGVFLFQTPQVTKDYASAETLESDRSGSSGLPESPERIALLESLLMDCRPSPGRATTTADMSTCNTLLHQLGVAYLSRREVAKAQDYLEDALTLAQQRDDAPLTAEVTQVLGRTLAEQRQFEAAERAYQNALAQFRQLGNQRGEANTLFYLGNVELDRRNFAQAETYYQQCLAIERALGDDYSTASTYHQLGMVAEDQRRVEDAIVFYQRALDLTEAAGDTYGAASTYHQLGIVAEEQRYFEDAIAFYQKALDLKEAAGDTYGAASTYHQLGIVAQKQNRFEDAIAAYQNALTIYEAAGDTYRAASTYHQLGIVAQKQNRFKDAIAAYQNALAIYEATGDDYQASYEYQGLGSIAKEQGDLATAIDHFQTAFAARQASNDWRRASLSLASWADALAAQDNGLEATQLYFQALALDQQHNPDYVDTDIENLGRMVNQLGESQFLALWPDDLAPESRDDLRVAIWQAAQAHTETQSLIPESP